MSQFASDGMRALFTAEEMSFRQEVRAFVAANLPSEIASKLMGGLHPGRADVETWTRILHERGWAAYSWPEEHGGPGFSPVERYIFEDECARAGAPELVPFGLKMVAPVIMKYGDDRQTAHYLPRIARLDDFWCQGYSEPGSGSDLASLKTRAVLEGDRYIVDGQKVWTTSAHEADWIFCLVRTSKEDKRQNGITFLLIDLRSQGITIRPIITLDGKHEINEVWFEGVEVPVENRVGEEGKGWTYAKYLLEHERLNFGGMGFCKRELARLKAMAAETMRGGRPVLDDPGFKLRLEALEAELLAVDMTNLRFLREVAAGRENALQAPVLKIISSEIQQTISELQTRALGSRALAFNPRGTASNKPHHYAAENYCNMRKTTIYAGSNEIQRNIAAKGILG
ncbi:acyl-CoA dehydrogenase family protein [Oricola indica]|uniref:acyl-CoA dehydrogenase family protein n=1 Tax=Oricola indica TaxID=2872591 RepID=UPI003CCC0E29